MSEAYHKDVWRSIRKGWKRFLSILIITALGVGMLTGLYAAGLDMYYSADEYFDQQNLFDIRILSTLGLTQEDIEALSQVKGVEAVEGGYRRTVYTEDKDIRKSVEMVVLNSGFNKPYLLEGNLPSKEGEIAVIQKYLDETGKSIGDTLTIEQNEETPSFSNNNFTITGVVLDPTNIKSDDDGSSFRSTSTDHYTFFVTGLDAHYDIFTVAYITLADTKNMNSYSDEYKERVDSVVHEIESHLKKQREEARDQSILVEARSKIQDAENTMDERFAEADLEFSDAWREIAEARQELADGEATLVLEEKDAKRKISKAREEIESGKQRLIQAEKELAEGEAQLIDGQSQLNAELQRLEDGKTQLAQEKEKAEKEFAIAEQQFAEAQKQLDLNRKQLEAGIEQLKYSLGDAWPDNEWNALLNAATALSAGAADDQALLEGTAKESTALAAALQGPMSVFTEPIIEAGLGMGKVNGGQEILDSQRNAYTKEKQAALQKMADAEAELAAGEEEIKAARLVLEAKKLEVEEGKEELAQSRAELLDGEAKLKAEEASAKAKIARAWEDISKGKEELADGQAELVEKEKEYLEQKEEAQQEISDAYAELEDIDKAKWYVQDRTSLDSYSSLDSDLSSIEAIGSFFPIIFLLVAILMSLTTMTRMVEEERGLIGTYKAMGLSNAVIYRKYLLFAFIPCLLGGLLGNLFGFIVLPRFIMTILKVLYNLPVHYLRYDFLYGIGSILLFVIAIVGATALACRNELKQMPAKLLRPKAPRPGSRVFLERISFIWNRLSFLNKVTIRNLFRYKKRLFMTIGGIMGCTALILCGFAIKDSVAKLGPHQYNYFYQYDLMAVFDEDDHDDMVSQLASDKNIEKHLSLRIEAVKVINDQGRTEQVQLLVIPKGQSIEDYIRIISLDGKPIKLDDQGVVITQNAARLLKLEVRDSPSLQTGDLVQYKPIISEIAQNHLGNNVYMTEALYESLYDSYSPNGIIAHLSDSCSDHTAYAEDLLDNDSVLTAISTANLLDNFQFDLINAVVLLLIIMAGGLAFVVLFTLSNTNISERVRELATIKVLGFYDHEVYQYVNKETLILTLVGILMGMPAGYVLSSMLMATLNMPSIHFTLHIEPVSYLISAAITLFFALIVNLIMNRTLDRINMVEALKSVE